MKTEFSRDNEHDNNEFPSINKGIKPKLIEIFSLDKSRKHLPSQVVQISPRNKFYYSSILNRMAILWGYNYENRFSFIFTGEIKNKLDAL